MTTTKRDFKGRKVYSMTDIYADQALCGDLATLGLTQAWEIDRYLWQTKRGILASRTWRWLRGRHNDQKATRSDKCIVKECPNRADDGIFRGPICEPCATALEGSRFSAPAAKRISASLAKSLDKSAAPAPASISEILHETAESLEQGRALDIESTLTYKIEGRDWAHGIGLTQPGWVVLDAHLRFKEA